MLMKKECECSWDQSVCAHGKRVCVLMGKECLCSWEKGVCAHEERVLHICFYTLISYTFFFFRNGLVV